MAQQLRSVRAEGGRDQKQPHDPGGYVVKMKTGLKVGATFITFIIQTSPAQLMRRWGMSLIYPGD